MDYPLIMWTRGRPSASHYFVGHQGENFFYLDPHQARPKLPYYAEGEGYLDDDIASCHTRRLRRLHVEKLDPSMLIAFLIQNEEDWCSWRISVNSMNGKPVVHIADHEPVVSQIGDELESDTDGVEAFDDEDQDEDGEMIKRPASMDI